MKIFNINNVLNMSESRLQIKYSVVCFVVHIVYWQGSEKRSGFRIGEYLNILFLCKELNIKGQICKKNIQLKYTHFQDWKFIFIKTLNYSLINLNYSIDKGWL